MANSGASVLTVTYAILLSLASVQLVTDSWQRRTLGFGLLGITVFCGVGIMTTEVHPDYPNTFALFTTAFAASFIACSRLLPRPLPTEDGAPPWLLHLERERVALVVVLLFIGARLSALVFPELRIGNLFTLQPPDLSKAFAARLAGESTGGGALTRYGATLLYPFYLISLAAFRRRPAVFAFFVCAPPWIQYASDSYISRGELALPLLFLAGNAWLLFPKARLWMAGTALVASPVFLVALAQFAAARIGQDAGAIDLSLALESVLRFETSMPGYSSAIMDESQRGSVRTFLLWALTLPIPKALFGEVVAFRLNHEIAEMVLGVSMQDDSFFVFLTGLVSESVYLFGSAYFWMHAALIGGFLAAFSRVGPDRQSFDFVRLYTVYAAGYLFPRGGVASGLPPLVNGFLALFLVLWLTAALSAQRKRHWSTHHA